MRRAAPLLLAALLAGCQLAPPHERPALPTAAHYPDEYAPAQAGVDPAEIDWQRFFTDPRLQRLIETALANNRDLRIAVARIEEARGQYRVQDADRYPSLGLGAEASRGRYPAGASSAGGAGLGGGGLGSGGGLDGGAGGGGTDGASLGSDAIVERYFLGLSVSAFELDFWGRVRNLGEAARAQYLATAEAQRAFRLSLIADVAATYLAVREAEQRIELAEQTLRTRREGLEIEGIRLDAGITSALAFHQAAALLTQAETELATLRLTRAQQRNYLAQLIGGELPEALPPAEPLTAQLQVTRLAAGLPSDLLYRRPDIIAAEQRLRAARANIGVARAAFFPQISLTGSFGYASTELSNLVDSDNEMWSIGPTISLPLFDWGRNRGNLTVAEARETVAVAEYEQAIQTAFREVADALAGRRYLAEQVLAQRKNVATLQRIAELANARHAEGVITYLEVLDAERNLFDARQALIQAQRAQVQNLVELYIALGGGLPGATEGNAP
ncbi:efflux transporter outer membrane subunit [Stutzerimonas azotifigens]|uniref:efflux transporter outer membrane subunit n=1 Tax=Stutzerimonas azotifigens TaxID=291995 RepID=UPI0004257891|nr:efflux transporter outer membrane subunit [Stutzerimonas azotifigens]